MTEKKKTSCKGADKGYFRIRTNRYPRYPSDPDFIRECRTVGGGPERQKAETVDMRIPCSVARQVCGVNIPTPREDDGICPSAAVHRFWNQPRRPKMLARAKRCSFHSALPQIYIAHLGNLGTRSIHPNGPITQLPVPKGKFDILFWGRDEFSCIALQRLYEASKLVNNPLS